MPARKPYKKLALKPTKASAQVIRPLYALPILEAVARGDVGEMRKLSKEARKQIADVTKALHSMDSAIMKLSGK